MRKRQATSSFAVPFLVLLAACGGSTTSGAVIPEGGLVFPDCQDGQLLGVDANRGYVCVSVSGSTATAPVCTSTQALTVEGGALHPVRLGIDGRDVGVAHVREVGQRLLEDHVAVAVGERDALRLLLAEPGLRARGVVIGAGGGLVVDPDNRATIAAAGIVVFLEVGIDELCARLLTPAAREQRPLLAGEASLVRARLEELLVRRQSAYGEANVVVDAGGSPQDAVRRLLAALPEA